jgi:hypothetical protein
MIPPVSKFNCRYDVQMAVDAKHHLITAHEAMNVGNDRRQFSDIAKHACTAEGTSDITVAADRGLLQGRRASVLL